MRQSPDLTARLGGLMLRTPLIAASGTVGSVVEIADVADLSVYGAAVAKSVSGEPWPGRPPLRVGPAGSGMLNSVGIQNPGIERWAEEMEPVIPTLGVPVWGSAVGKSPDEFARVAKGLERAGVDAVEVNLSCPNLEGEMFSLDPSAAAEVLAVVGAATNLPVGAKLSPNAQDIVTVARAVREAGADFLVLTNTVWGAAIDIRRRRPLLNTAIGGYSGPPLKPIALRCVVEVHRDMPDMPIVGCGGIASGVDVVEYVLAGASAVALGTVHFSEPRAGKRILAELKSVMSKLGVDELSSLRGAVEW